MHERDRDLILKTQEFFGGIGYVSNPNKNTTVEFRVSTINDIVNVIIPHFDNYPLLTKKYSDYVLFKNIIKLILEKEHSTFEGIQKIVNLKASINLGLSNELKEAFPETIPVEREVKNITVIPQDSIDLSLLESFVNFFECGYVAKYKNRSVCEFIVTKIDHVVNNIIPFFDKHSIRGSKYSDFLNFKSAALIIKNKEHLKEDGLNQILQLKNQITGLKTKNNHGDD